MPLLSGRTHMKVGRFNDTFFIQLFCTLFTRALPAQYPPPSPASCVPVHCFVAVQVWRSRGLLSKTFYLFDHFLLRIQAKFRAHALKRTPEHRCLHMCRLICRHVDGPGRRVLPTKAVIDVQAQNQSVRAIKKRALLKVPNCHLKGPL